MTAARSGPGDRTVVGNICLSLDGRFTGPGGEHDMSWIVPHAVTDRSRPHMVRVTCAAATALLGRKSYQGFASFWPAVADDETADPRGRAFARWLSTRWRKSSSRAPCRRPKGTTRASSRATRPLPCGNCASRKATTLSSSPARASSGACSRPANWIASASRCARSWSAAAPACSTMIRQARHGPCLLYDRIRAGQ